MTLIYKIGSEIWGPPKKIEAQNIEMWHKECTILQLGREYLPETCCL